MECERFTLIEHTRIKLNTEPNHCVFAFVISIGL